MKQIDELPTPEGMKEMFPIDEETKQIKKRRDEEVQKILSGEDGRLILVIGPCSADREDAVLEYISRLAKLQEKVADRIYMIPRVYTNKPRTKGTGYKGMLHQPDARKDENMLAGIIAIRQLHTNVVKQSGFTSADEMLYPENYAYLSDLLGYVAVGARSVEDQQHRMVASGINAPVGMKNPTGGDISVMMNAMIAAQSVQKFVYRGWEVETSGNPFAHAILRGYVDKFGISHPNYHYEDLRHLIDAYAATDLANPGAIVDCNHANSGKKFNEQIRIAKDIMHSCHVSGEVNRLVKGLMIESYLVDGSQQPGGSCYGQSITDPCLGWEKTEKLVYELADLVEM